MADDKDRQRTVGELEERAKQAAAAIGKDLIDKGTNGQSEKGPSSVEEIKQANESATAQTRVTKGENISNSEYGNLTLNAPASPQPQPVQATVPENLSMAIFLHVYSTLSSNRC